MIKSYRGKLAKGEQDTIPLHTNNGKTGYRIVKFQLMAIDPISNNQESVVKIYLVPPAAVDGLIDFSDGTLLAAGYMESDGSGATPTFNEAAIMFDNVKFNQDIYVTHHEQGSDACNYYIELEQMDLTEDQALVAIVKNLRNEQ